MTSITKSLYAFSMLTLLTSSSLYAFEPKETVHYFNGPTVSAVTDTTASLSLSDKVLAGISLEEKANIYFEYFETHKMCIMIYPTPEECLPKKTALGELKVAISKLKPETSYTVSYKKDDTIRCIQAPCPENGFQSLETVFVTGKASTATPVPAPVKGGGITKNLFFKSYGKEVAALQEFLKAEGYFEGEATGYFGVVTKKAVQEYQKSLGISPTGFVGVLTRAKLTLGLTEVTEKFSGKITALSTNCFADGICSVTVDGKEVILIVGRKQGAVGKLEGVESIGDIEQKIGATADVYARKTVNGYTLYGNNDYYVRIK